MNDDIAALRRAANANLVALADGTAKRQVAERRAAAKASREAGKALARWEREDARERRAEEKALRTRLVEIEGVEESVKVDFPPELRHGALEELDAERDTICERLYRMNGGY